MHAPQLNGIPPVSWPCSPASSPSPPSSSSAGGWGLHPADTWQVIAQRTKPSIDLTVLSFFMVSTPFGLWGIDESMISMDFRTKRYTEVSMGGPADVSAVTVWAQGGQGPWPTLSGVRHTCDGAEAKSEGGDRSSVRPRRRSLRRFRAFGARHVLADLVGGYRTV